MIAKQDKESSVVTDMPSSTPSIAADMPSKTPSIPVVQPIQIAPPSHAPKPVSSPASSPTPSPAPSPAPSRSELTSAPSEASKFTYVILPDMDIKLSVSGSLKEEDLESSLRSFINETLMSTAQSLGNITSVNTSVTLSLVTARRRLQVTAMVATVSGNVTFSGEISEEKAPTTEKLRRVLESYFANWGGNDLEERLSDSNIVVSDVEVLLDGELVESSSPDESPSNGVAQKQDTISGDSVGLIAGLVLGSLVFVFSLAFVFYRRREDAKLEAMVTTPATSPSRSRAEASALPDDFDPNLFAVDSPSLSGLSMEDSLFTSGNTSDEHNAQTYDPTRLDKVISDAMEFVDQHQDDEDEYVASDEETSKASQHTPPKKNEDTETPSETGRDPDFYFA